jgi:hypothetical protein
MRIINVHNKLRFIAFLQLCGILLYMVLSEFVSINDTAWMHGVHLAVQPLVFISTLYLSKTLSAVACGASCIALAVDIMVAFVNGIVVTRCYDDVNATCVQRVAASTLWLALAIVHCILGYFGATSAFRAYELAKPAIIYQYLRIRTVCWFLFPQDVLFAALLVTDTLDLLTLAHPVVNFLGVWISYRNTRSGVSLYYLFGTLAAVMLGLDVFSVERLWGTEGETQDMFKEHLALLLYGVYMFTDVLLMLFSVGHVQRSTRKES